MNSILFKKQVFHVFPPVLVHGSVFVRQCKKMYFFPPEVQQSNMISLGYTYLIFPRICIQQT